MRLVLAGMATVLTLAACSSPDVPDVDTGLPSSTVSLPASTKSARPVPPPAHKWKTDGLTCPSLTAADVGLTGAGKVTDQTNPQTVGSSIDCAWGTTATLHLDTATTQAAADAQWQILSGALSEELSGVGEQAFISTDTGSDEIQVVVRSGNANLDIRLTAKKDDEAGAKALRDAAPAIATDMLKGLVPA
ncbi:hypothetical protein BJ973_007939 [Actinoplanes tereljensis]|uniref:DUF3558 domain-containing protein n=1 Tax=Paractinoplanes tereljensis TaxID=571912 RepID=A0A919NSP6_9ACTN|nr:hypothetical protein [Actinoplanes tereljensis]GIF24459.1 hypothetical protein Ate02nite_71890 [Actinoplanes tereljensis]